MKTIKNKTINLFLIGAFLILVLHLGFQNLVCNSFVAKSSLGESPVIDKDKIWPGYNLITPVSQRYDTEANEIFLTDNYGRIVKQWKTDFAPFYAVMRNNGNIVTSLVSPFDPRDYPGIRTGIMEEMDWKGNVLWKYENDLMHHDIALVPNGRTAALVWTTIPEDISQKIQGGISGTEIEGEIWGDRIIELDNTGKIVWSWNAYEHMDPKIDIIPDYAARNLWSIINGISYMEKDPIEGKEAYLVSMRGVNKVVIVRREDGEIIWRSNPGLMSGQHDAKLLENGNILVFDNNIANAQSHIPVGSSVVEINPKTQEEVWRLDNGLFGIESSRFYSYLVGGAQRLPNGNTLVADGLHGHLFEVTEEKELVWDFINPYFTKPSGIWPNNAMFKAKRYSQADINWPEKLPSSMPMTGEICQKLDRIF